MKIDHHELRDDKSAEGVMYPFVLIVALVVILGFVLSGISAYAESGQVSQGMYPGLTNPFGLYNYTTIDALATDDRYVVYDGTQGYEVTDGDILDYVPYPTDEDPFIFVDPEDENELKYVHVVRNNRDYDPESTEMWEKYLDFFAVRRHPEAKFFWDDD